MPIFFNFQYFIKTKLSGMGISLFIKISKMSCELVSLFFDLINPKYIDFYYLNWKPKVLIIHLHPSILTCLKNIVTKIANLFFKVKYIKSIQNVHHLPSQTVDDLVNRTQDIYKKT